MTTNLIDIQNSDVIMATSNFAENHPVGFQWVMKAKERGAKFIHVDPRFTRTSAAADIHVPIRSGTNIAFFGGLINYAIQHNLYFRDYVVHYTNASFLIDPEFKTATDLDGLFTGWDESKRGTTTDGRASGPARWSAPRQLCPPGVRVAGPAGPDAADSATVRSMALWQGDCSRT